MASTERVTIRIQSDKLALLQNLVDSGEFESISDAIREAMDEFVRSRFTPENIAKITVDLPRGNVTELENLIKEGDSVSIDDAIRNAVREYTRARAKNQRILLTESLKTPRIVLYSHFVGTARPIILLNITDVPSRRCSG